VLAVANREQLRPDLEGYMNGNKVKTFAVLKKNSKDFAIPKFVS
jgi:hypothetical protein